MAEVDFVLPKPFSPKDLEVVLDDSIVMRNERRRVPHILVIDDCRVVRKITTSALAKNTYRISEARSMEEAFERIDIAHVDIVLVDIFMPGMGGIEGISIIRKTWPNVQIIAISAGKENHFGGEEVLKAACHIGATQKLVKPFTADQVNAVVDDMLKLPTDQKLAI